jgi:hypothetical protein
MFGSNDKNQPGSSQQPNNPATGTVAPAAPPQDNLVTSSPDPFITPTAPPLNDSLAAPTSATPTPEPTLPPLPPQPELPKIVTGSAKNQGSSDAAAPAPVNGADDELINIKQQALHSLAPLVDQLEQTPEEKFKTTMMLIQASDNAALIKDAYDAANAIADERSRAQALLDVVNEINYFTQHQNAEQQ